MVYDVQKANFWKRFSAYLVDILILALVAVEIAFLLSLVLDFQGTLNQRNDLKEEYEQHYGVDFDITQEDYDKLTDSEKNYLNDAHVSYITDPECGRLDALLVNLALIIATFSLLIAYLLLEFLVPMLFRNGQTFGKKIFGVGVVRVDGVRISTFQLFVRTVLGKCTVETLIPVFLIFLFFLNFMPLFSIMGFALLFIIQFVSIVVTKLHTPIHELMSATVSVDMSSQTIFDSPEALMEYKKQLHSQDVEKAEYK
jgi:uncharacterized RDD family membrane protein YckC